jgi:ATP-dependent RNA helicase DDX46/PRP5
MRTDLQLHLTWKPQRVSLALLQGPTESSVKAAKAEIKRILEDSTERAMRREAGAGGVAPGRYSIV